MSDPMPSRGPAICLNMIVRNEAHIVHELLDSVAPFITSWVIVDTGSDDGTQDAIRQHTAALGIPGELHERPWRNFGHNRSEAIALAAGHGDYIWVMDADDLLIGAPDFTKLDADCYQLRYGGDVVYWRRQLFRDGLPWHYVGVVHEYADCAEPYVDLRLDGEYHIESRRLGGRNLDPQKYLRDAELLLAEVQRNPDDPRSVFYLAQSYHDYGDFASARIWYQRRTEMAGYNEEIYYSLLRLGDTMSRLDEPWPDVQNTYLRAWEFRPTRAEALYAIARRYRTDQRYQLGYLFAERAAQIPLPEKDALFVGAEVYAWRALDEQAVCASWIGKQEEAFTICRALLGRDDLAEGDRQRIAANRDLMAPRLIDTALTYPDDLAQSLGVAPRDGDVTVSLVIGADRGSAERTLNSFIRCFADVSRVGRVVAVDIGLWPDERTTLSERYPFLEFLHFPPGVSLGQIRAEISGRYWLYLGMGWQFFTSEDVIGRLTGVLETEPEVFQVGINYGDADKLTGARPPENTVRRNVDGGRYVLSETAADGPAMFDCARLDRVRGADAHASDTIADLRVRSAEAGLKTATLDEVLCVLQS